MNDWNYGYFTADTYTYGYYRELSPTFQNFCLLLRGFAAPTLNENSKHCELGFGQGVSINVHAAATPGMYYGTDFNPAHAAHANELCEASGCGAKFFDNSFEQMLNRDDLPQFDSISLHGTWSWVSAENQNIIVEFARKYLKSGGVFYNSYNCLPGWAAKSPLRELLSLYDEFVGKNESNTYNRVEGALKFTDELLKAKPLYAATVPNIENIFESMKKDNHNYLAHEYLNRDWICMYFADVVNMMSSAKLDFACTALPLESIDQANLTQTSIEFLNKISNPIMREQARDYFINRQFRKDIFMRGARRILPVERRHRLMNTNFVLMTTDKLEMKCNTTIGEIGFNNPDFDDAMGFLASDNYRPRKFADLLKVNSEIKPENIEQIIAVMVDLGKIMPCQDESAVEKVKPQCDKMNEYFCKRAETSHDITEFASPVLGGGIAVDRFEQLFTQFHKQGAKDAEDMANKAWNIIEPQGQRLIKEGKPLEAAEDNIAEFKGMAERFLDKRLPILQALQIV